MSKLNLEQPDYSADQPQESVFKRFLPIIIVLVAAGALAGLAFRPAPKKEEAAATVIPPVKVSVMTIQPLPELKDTFRIPGIVEPWAMVRISAEVPGRIEKIAANEGDTVKPEQPLVYLDTDLLKAAYDRAKAQADFDDREVGRLDEIAKHNAATVREVDTAKATSDGSRAALSSAEAQLRRAVIKAPPKSEAGSEQLVLNELPVKAGTYVMPGTYVAQVVDVSVVKVCVDIPERDVPYLKLGQIADVVVDLPNQAPLMLKGEIIFISATADDKTRTFRTDVKIDNAARLLRGGMIVEVQLMRRIVPNAMMIPLECIIPLENGYEVYVSENGLAQRRQVKLGILRERMAQALPAEPGERSLMPGERLIVKGQRMVGEGQAVVELPDPEAWTATAPATRPAGEAPAVEAAAAR